MTTRSVLPTGILLVLLALAVCAAPPKDPPAGMSWKIEDTWKNVKVDEAEAARLGLSLDIIAQTVYAGFQGDEATIIREGNDEIIVRVKLMEPYRSQPDSLSRLTVPNQTGRMIPLGRVASFERQPGLPAPVWTNP